MKLWCGKNVILSFLKQILIIKLTAKMKKILLLFAILLSFNSVKAQMEEIVSYEVQMKTNIGSTMIESFLLPEGTEFFIYQENGNSFLVVNIPKESTYPEPHVRRKLAMNVVDFKVYKN